ncbi:ZIP family metal transporter [Halobacillus halophilus]|uniref:ZIP family metal transporter n=1 Tax=Halobacillus halophilus TaxID=1570 RepID=UPI001CD64F9C|nr:ZIP family metal transporter [Halobacillus halophilus]MCA1011983.1 ZIP family metal transporter [Halobacillus halophilus]
MDSNIMVMIASALATVLGAIPVLFIRNISHRRMDIILAYTAGVMMAASTYGLIPASLKLTNLYILGIGVLTGALILNMLEYFIPHTDMDHEREDIILSSQSWMLIVAMTLHNIPEGLSVGASLASEIENLGLVVALSMALQNAPEGFLVAIFLVNQRVSKAIAITFAMATGIMECLAGFAGLYLVQIALFLVPYGLAFAAGAMLFIVYKELIPESHGHGYERLATFSFLLGLLSMIGLVEWFR